MSTHTTPEVEEFRNKILDVETAIRLTYNEKDSDAMVAKMLDFITTLTTKHQEEIKKAVEAERDRIRQEVKDMALAIKCDAHFMTELQVCQWLDEEVLTPTKTDKQNGSTTSN